MPESFGARLRQQREARQIDLVAISEQTKIKLALLEALENGDVSHWPSGIFRRAYIRAYAQFIGLDPDVLLREFLEVHPDPADAIVASAADAAAAEEAYAKHAPAMRFRSIVGSALGSLTRFRRPNVDEKRPVAGADEGHLPAEARAAHVEDYRSWSRLPAVSPEGAVRLDVEAGPELDVAAATLIEGRVEAVECGSLPDVEPLVEAPVEAPVGVGEVEGAKEAEVPMAEAPKTEVLPEPELPPVVATVATEMSQAAQLDHDEVLETVARLCTEFGRVVERGAVRELLQESADALSAAGLIVWLADEAGETLRPGLVQGYSDRILAQLPAVTRDADNATATAFRTARPCQVAPTAHTSGALVVPLLVPDGCAGVLAIELQQGVRMSRSLRAIAVLVAAALTQLLYRSRPVERSAPPVERPAPAVAQFRPAARPMKVRR
jgi:transcriptional regulator with XRE-family HTH domain